MSVSPVRENAMKNIIMTIYMHTIVRTVMQVSMYYILT